VYCADNPVKFVDTTGMFLDDYQLEKDGNINWLKETKASTHTIYASKDNGKIDKKNSIEVSKDVLNSKVTEKGKAQDSNGNIFPVEMNVYTTFGDDKSTAFFEFAAKNSDVEWSQVKAEIAGSVGYEEVNYIGTTIGSDGMDASQSYIESFIPDGVTIREANHSHPNNSITVSQGDVNVATKIQSRFSNATFNIFTPSNSKYTPYNMFSTPGLLQEVIIKPK
jgi:hypothetical protein